MCTGVAQNSTSKHRLICFSLSGVPNDSDRAQLGLDVKHLAVG